MPLVVEKYGGTSVATEHLIKNIAKRVVKTMLKGNEVVVVVSAQAGVTDSLLNKAKSVSRSPTGRELDVIISTGEQITIALLALAIKDLGYQAISLTATQAKILTCDSFNKAQIKSIDTELIKKEVKKKKIVIVAGFQGVTKGNEITTLGRGGSDITAVALGAALNAQKVCIYTDVNGVYSADPRVVENSKLLNNISYEEMMEMSSSGAKVLHSRSVELAAKYKIPLVIASSFTDQGGTVIKEDGENMEQSIVSGIAYDIDIAKITVVNIKDYHINVAHILDVLASSNINIKLFTKNYIDDSINDFTLLIPKSEYEKTKDLIKTKYGSNIFSAENIGRVSVIGIGLKSTTGIASKVINSLTNKDIKVNFVSCSDINISCVVEDKNCLKAVKILHDLLIG